MRRSLLAGPVLEVAPKLLGMVLRRTTDEGTVAVRITEVEAYDGPNDPGSHAYRGETARNSVMFGPPGHLYVYFTYGMHFCMNISAGPDGEPSAVLLRAGEIIEGADLARIRRGHPDTAQTKFNQSTALRPGRGGGGSSSTAPPPEEQKRGA
ncbi:MAG TPA: DNA-3-methyladenine glycosylase, partial [Kribbella sp.]